MSGVIGSFPDGPGAWVRTSSSFRSALSRTVFSVMGMVGFPLRNDCCTAITFGRTQVAGLLASQVYNQFLQDDSWVYHAKLQRVIAGLIQSVFRFADANAVLHRFLPRFLGIVGEDVNGLWHLIIKTNFVSQSTAGNEVQRWR